MACPLINSLPWHQYEQSLSRLGKSLPGNFAKLIHWAFSLLVLVDEYQCPISCSRMKWRASLLRALFTSREGRAVSVGKVSSLDTPKLSWSFQVAQCVTSSFLSMIP